MLSQWLPHEKDLVSTHEQISEIKRLAEKENLDLSDKIERLETMWKDQMRSKVADFEPFDKVRMARHPKRPYSLDYINALTTEWVELHGDRRFGDDQAVVAGFARFRGRPVAIVGNQKGRDLKERQARNFGQPSPEGLRKAGRVMEMAGRFGRPVISFVDTPGAACSPEAEQRGISEAIAASQMLMSRLPVPIIVVITGEGCSGGAIATALGDRVLMLEYAYYSVISPEACASILYKDNGKANLTSKNLRITSDDARNLGIIEEVIPEPLGGAHWDVPAMNRSLGDAIEKYLDQLTGLDAPTLLEQRYQRFRKYAAFEEAAAENLNGFHPELNGNLPEG